jgi:hypothetical protein
MADLLPVEESKLAAWLDEMLVKIRPYLSSLGISEAAFRSVEADSTTLAHLIQQVERAKPEATTHSEAYKHLVAFKDLMKNGPSETLKAAFPSAVTETVTRIAPGVLPRLFALISEIHNSPKYTPEIGKALDIENTGVPAADYIPTGDNELLGWMQKFNFGFRDNAAALGMKDSDVYAVQHDHDALAHLVKEVDVALNDGKRNTAFRELVDYKDFIKYGLLEKAAAVFPAAATPTAIAVMPGILPRLQAFFGGLVENKGMTAAIASALGLALPAAALGTAATASMGAAAGTAATDEKKLTAPVITPRPAPAPVPIPAPSPAAVAEPGGTRWLFPILGILGLGVLALLFWPKGTPTPAETGTTVAVASPIPVATPEAVPTPMSLEAVVAERGAGDILLLYEKGTTEWIEPAAAEFNKTQSGGKILLTSLGSREGRDHILYDKKKIQPVLWNPGDTYWIEKLQIDASNPNLAAKSGATVNESKALLKTTVVLLMKEDRAKVFEAAMQQSAYRGKTWKLLSDIATNGWTVAGGNADWGKLKLTHSNPARSNSGMLALTLMYQEYAKANPGKTVNDAGFGTMMAAVESATGGKFAETTSDVLKDFESADAAVVYEADALRAIESGMTNARIVYPAPTVSVVLPIGIVEGKWVDGGQQELGGKFIDYLLSPAVQEKALAQGYRPAIESLASKVDAYFGDKARADKGMQRNPVYNTEFADTRTKEGLIFNWTNWYKKTYNKDPMAGG